MGEKMITRTLAYYVFIIICSLFVVINSKDIYSMITMLIVLGLTLLMFLELLLAYYRELQNEREIEFISRIEDIVIEILNREKE